MSVKANVSVFDQDVLATGTYQYSDSTVDIAKKFSNSRTSRAIAQSADFAGKTVLDVGCGDGVFTLELAALGVKAIIGIDPAAKAIVSASARSVEAGLQKLVTFQTFNVYDLDPRFGHFDIVVLRGVLHHLAEPDRALLAVASVCDQIVIMEPNGCNPVLKLIERFSAYHIEHEEQSFFPSTIDKWLRLAGKPASKRQLVNFVPLFCNPILARVLKWLEPKVEAVPMVRLIGCGQYIVRAG